MKIISVPEDILSEHNEILEGTAQALLERETLDLKDVDAIINEIEPDLLPSLPVKIMTYNIKPAPRAEDPVAAPAADGDGQDEDAQTPQASPSSSPEVN